MNYRFFFGLFSLMCFISQVRAWYWRSNGQEELENALKNGINTFVGYGVETWNDEFKKEICVEAGKAGAKTSRITDFVGCEYPMYSNKEIVVSTVTDMTIFLTNSNEKLSVKVFQCGSDENMTYYYGQGPFNKQMAVYVEYLVGYGSGFDGLCIPLGIMQGE